MTSYQFHLVGSPLVAAAPPGAWCTSTHSSAWWWARLAHCHDSLRCIAPTASVTSDASAWMHCNAICMVGSQCQNDNSYGDQHHHQGDRLAMHSTTPVHGLFLGRVNNSLKWAACDYQPAFQLQQLETHKSQPVFTLQRRHLGLSHMRMRQNHV